MPKRETGPMSDTLPLKPLSAEWVAEMEHKHTHDLLSEADIEQIRAAFAPLIDALPAVMDTMRVWAQNALDALASVVAAFGQPADMMSYDVGPESCWADVWDPTAEDYRSCSRVGAGELGLCWQHARKVASR